MVVIVKRSVLKKKTESKFFNNTFLKEKLDFKTIDQDKDFKGKPVQLKAYPNMQGKALFITKLDNESLVAIEIDDETKVKEVDKNVTLYDNIRGRRCVVLVRVMETDLNYRPLKYFGNTDIIDMASVETNVNSDSKKLLKDDIVKYTNVNGKCYGKIEEFKLLNDFRCVGLINCMELLSDNDVVYVREDKVEKIQVNDSMTKYIGDAIIDPTSIITCRHSQDTNLKTDDEVEFTMTTNSTSYQGKIVLIVEINGAQSVMVELTDVPDIKIFEGFVLNGVKTLQDEFKFQKMVVIVKRSALKKKDYFFMDTFFIGDIDMAFTEEIANSGKLVGIKDRRDIYGRFLSAINWKNEALFAIEVNYNYLRDHANLFKDIRLYNNKSGRKTIIIVKKKYVQEIKEPIKYSTDGKIIDMTSINMREFYSSDVLHEGDIVKFENLRGIFCGRINKLEILNYVPCVSLINCDEIIGDNNEMYVREEDVSKVNGIDGRRIQYYDDIIIAPESIVTVTPSSDPDIEVDDEVEWTLKDAGVTLDGRVRLIVEVNNVASAIVELMRPLAEVDLSLYKINNIQFYQNKFSFKNDAFLIRGSPTIRKKYYICDKNKVLILNPANVDSYRDGSEENKIIKFEGEGETIVTKLLWRGFINNRSFIGCELHQETLHGTDGIFNNKRLFNCAMSRGVLIPLDKIKECCVNGTHRRLRTSSDARVIGSSICCAKKMDKFTIKQNFNLNDKVKHRSGISGFCRWIGSLNGVDVIGLESERRPDNWQDLVVEKLALFDDTINILTIFKADEFILDDEFYFFKKIYVNNGINFNTVNKEMRNSKLVIVKDEQSIYGREAYNITWRNEKVTAIKIDNDYMMAHRDMFKDIKLYECGGENWRLILVRSSYVKDFDERLECVNMSGIIVKDSVKLREKYESRELRQGDIVRYKDGDGKDGCHGRIMKLELLNDIRCVAVVNSIEVPLVAGEVYIREDAVTKVRDEDIRIIYYGDVVIDPRTIVTMTQSSDVNLEVGDQVEFTLTETGVIYEGTVTLIVEVNGAVSAIVELLDCRDEDEISNYTINNNGILKNISQSPNATVIVRGSPVTRKKYFFCEVNKVTILNPGNVDYVDEKLYVEDKMIRFKSKEGIVVARLLLRGSIKNRSFIGCELTRETEFGTDGIFNGNRFFTCTRGKGALIPLDKIKECCVNGQHRQLETLDYGRIIGSSICCAKKMEYLKDRSDIKLREKMMAIKEGGHVHGTCRWIGLLNDTEVMAVETENVRDDWFDQDLDNLKLFDNILHKIVLFLPEHFYPVDLQNFYKNIFFKNDVDRTSTIRSVDTGKLVYVQGHQGTYGRLRFRTLWNQTVLIGIEIDEEYLQTHEDIFKHMKLNKNDKNVKSIIVAKSIYVKDFKEPLQYVRGSAVIDIDSVKVTERCEPRKLKMNDIVKYDDGRRICYGRIERVVLLNNIRCIGVQNSIEVPGVHEPVYVQEDKVTKVMVEGSVLSYLEDTIIDPRSIMAMKQSKDEHINVDDEVDFRLKDAHVTLEGMVRQIVDIHGVISVIVELYCAVPDQSSKYLINDIPYFQDAYKFNKPAVFVRSTRIRKKWLFCGSNKVTIFNPKCVDNIEDQNIEKKIITFKSRHETVIAKMLWRGNCNGQAMIGCELTKESIHGTDGIFSDKTLFNCPSNKGALIPLDKIEECCVNGQHRQLDISHDGRIIGESICCAKSVAQLKDKEGINLGSNVKTFTKNGKIFGTCRWIGLVNDKDVIGLKMTSCYTYDDATVTQILTIEDLQFANVALFSAMDFVPNSVGQGYCYKNNVCILDSGGLEYVDVGESLDKKIKYRNNDKDVVLHVRWKGEAYGVPCVGCELDHECDCGKIKDINKFPKFEFTDGKVALVQMDCLLESCEHTKYLIDIDELSGDDQNGHHKTLITYPCGSINPESICCVETLNTTNDEYKPKIGCKLMFRKDIKIGNCKWIGLINGVPSIGARMKDATADTVGGDFSGFKIFECKNDQGMVFRAEDISRDVEGEELRFLVGKFVNIDNLWKVKDNRIKGTCDMTVGDYVETELRVGDLDTILRGELKWIGCINDVDCVGIDLETECGYGMDGVIKGRHKFACLPRHGIVTTMNNAKKCKEIPKLFYIEDGLIDPEKYMKFVEQWNEEQLKEKKLTKDGKITIVIDIEYERLKKSGILRWCGTTCGEVVAVVQLEKEYKNATNGRFWRTRLIQCDDRKAIAVPWKYVNEYTPYDKMEIPEGTRLFDEISINSAVVYYDRQNETMKNIYGTVKWSGIDDNDEYFYGIELDDRCTNGTDGTFKGQQLFHCQNRYGILVPIEIVAPDVRFIVQESEDKDIPESKDCDVCEYAIPTKRFFGENFGIQGNSNSCYFDSSIFALFSKSDVLDFMISGRVNINEQVEITKTFRGMMASNIVWPLRKYGAVSFHKTRDMRDVIKRYGAKFEEMTKHETDMENVAALLAKLSPDEQLLKLTTFKNPEMMNKNVAMFLQLFMTLDNRMKNISSQQMLEISMVQNDIMFDEPPTCLIMQAPRDARGINCYENVLPSRIIEISKLCLKFFKKCTKCDNAALWQCRACIDRFHSLDEALFCEEHKCDDENVRVHLPDSNTLSKSQVQMNLKAIICIEKAHFVSYVKENDFDNSWVFFDSMSTQNIANNYSVPKVTPERGVSQFLSLDERSMAVKLDSNVPSELKRIVKDSYIFVYHNSSKTCY